MLSTYAHLVSDDSNTAILRENNLAPINNQTKELTPTPCPDCNELNTPTSTYCIHCGTTIQRPELPNPAAHKDDVILNLVRLLTQRGLIDEALQTIHNARLGQTLKRLAEEKPTDDQKSTPETKSQPPPINAANKADSIIPTS